MATLRRTFLKLSGSALGAALALKGLNLFAEQEEEIDFAPQQSDWIVDRGNYYIVTVPEGKSFSRYDFDKPVLFMLKDRAEVSEVSIDGFITIVGSANCSFLSSKVDTSKTVLQKPRAAILIDRETRELVCKGNHIVTGPSSHTCIEVPGSLTKVDLLNTRLDAPENVISQMLSSIHEQFGAQRIRDFMDTLKQPA
jgi:hypothetical protein